MILALICLLGRLWAWITKPRHFDGDEKIYLTPTWSLTGSPKAVPKKQKRRKDSGSPMTERSVTCTAGKSFPAIPKRNKLPLCPRPQKSWSRL